MDIHQFLCGIPVIFYTNRVKICIEILTKMEATMAIRSHIPLLVKIIYSAFMAILVPVYWHYYGPTNFLYFCDMALFLTLAGVWLESPLLISMCCVGILLPQALWVADFFAGVFGFQLTGMTAYMFNETSSKFLRGLSLFHGWLPFLLVYLVSKTGYTRRGALAWTGLAWVLLLVCFFFMPGPNPDAGLQPVNINYVWGMNDAAAQTMMPAWAWFGSLLVALPLLIFLPTHLLLQRFAPQAK